MNTTVLIDVLLILFACAISQYAISGIYNSIQILLGIYVRHVILFKQYREEKKLQKEYDERKINTENKLQDFERFGIKIERDIHKD